MKNHTTKLQLRCMKYFLLLLVLSGCVACGASPEYYTLNNGLQVQCAYARLDACGMFLNYCQDGNTYYCQTNVRVIR